MKTFFTSAKKTEQEKRARLASETLAFGLFAVSILLFALSAVLHPNSEDASAWTILLYSALKVVIFVLPALVVDRIYQKNGIDVLRTPLPRVALGWQKIVLCTAAVSAIVVVQILYTMAFPEMASSVIVTEKTTIFTYIALAFMHVIVPAVTEELFFRGVVLHGLLMHRRLLAVVTSSLVFALTHFSATAFPLTFFCGLFLGIVFLWTGSVRCSIIVHALANLMTLVSATIFSLAFDIHATFVKIVFAVCIVLLFGGITALYKAVKYALGDIEEEVVPASNFWSLPMFLFIAVAALIQVL